MTTTAFIGAGNIAQALISGYLKTGRAKNIIAADPLPAQLAKLPKGIVRMQSNSEAIRDADVIVLCLKPNMMADICRELGEQSKGKLIISVAAGITVTSLSTWFGGQSAIIRCMPNTPALVQRGMTGLYANNNVTTEQRGVAESILGSVGLYHWFEAESALDAVTAISGSGPAYFFLVMEAMQRAGLAIGLSEAISKQLVLQTALGAAEMALNSDLSTEQLRLNVTSPGGTTEAAIRELIDGGLNETFIAAIKAAFQRSKELSGES